MSDYEPSKFGMMMRQLEAAGRARASVLKNVLGTRKPFEGIPLMERDVGAEGMEKLKTQMATVKDLDIKARVHGSREYSDPKFYASSANKIKDEIGPEKLAIYHEEQGHFRRAAETLDQAAAKMEGSNPLGAACLYEKAAMDHALHSDIDKAKIAVANAIRLDPECAAQICGRVASLVEGYMDLLEKTERREAIYSEDGHFEISRMMVTELVFAAGLIEKTDLQKASNLLARAGFFQYSLLLSPRPESIDLYERAAKLIEGIDPVRAADLRRTAVSLPDMMNF